MTTSATRPIDAPVPERRSRGIAAMVRRRLLFLAPVCALVSVGLFAAAAASPFDPLVGYLGVRYTTTSEVDKALIANELGFDTSWISAYLQWLGGLVSGDLGQSRSYGQPVSEVLAGRLPWTLLLTGVGLAAAASVALVVGTVAGTRAGGLLDRIVSSFCLAIQGLPPFVLSLGVIAVFALGLGWLPVAGVSAGGADPTLGGVARHLILPASVLAVSQLPWLLLAVRESVVTARGADFVSGALARGIPTSTITRCHIVPTALAPFVTVLGVRLPELVVGAVLVEEIFGWPGIAGALVQSARDLDMALLAILTLGTTAAVMLGSLLADIAVIRLDPRVRADG